MRFIPETKKIWFDVQDFECGHGYVLPKGETRDGSLLDARVSLENFAAILNKRFPVVQRPIGVTPFTPVASAAVRLRSLAESFRHEGFVLGTHDADGRWLTVFYGRVSKLWVRDLWLHSETEFSHSDVPDVNYDSIAESIADFGRGYDTTVSLFREGERIRVPLTDKEKIFDYLYDLLSKTSLSYGAARNDARLAVDLSPTAGHNVRQKNSEVFIEPMVLAGDSVISGLQRASARVEFLRHQTT